VVFESPLMLPEDGSAVRLQFVLSVDGDGASFHLFSRPAADESGPWTRHSSGRAWSRAAAGAAPEPFDLEPARRRCEPVAEGDFYAELEDDHGFIYGPTFRSVRQLRWRPGEATARVELPAASNGANAQMWFHPGLLDSALQTAAQALKGSPTLLPSEIGRMVLYQPAPGAVWCHSLVTDGGPAADGSRVVDVVLCDEEGAVVAEVRDLLLRRLSRHGAGSLIHRLRWQESELEAAPAAAAAPGAPGWWLLLADGEGVAEALGGLFEARGETSVRVERDATLDPADPEGFKRLLGEAGADLDGPCRGVVDLWNLDLPAAGEADGSERTADELDADLAVGTTPLLWLLQALAEEDWNRMVDTPAAGTRDERPRLWCVTRGAQAVDPAEHVAVAQAPAWGLGRVALREHPELWGGLVDLDPAADAAAAAVALFDELDAAAREPGVAFREGRRYVLRLGPGGGAGGTVPALRPDASYLITGGLGDLGLAAARWLAEHGARRLVLAGRSGLPPRSTWAALDADDPVAARVAAVRAIEALGVDVHPVALDVADADALAAFLAGFEREGWPPVRGVVHAAGVLADRLLSRLTAADLETVWRPKVRASWNLHRAFRDPGLDFFVLYSSVASVLGTFGQGNYAAGNAFLDALAQERRASGLAGLSVNWGPWAEIGMAARTDPSSLQAQAGIQMLSPSEGADCLGRAMAAHEAQLLVARVEWGPWAESMGSEPARRLVERLVEPEPGSAGAPAAAADHDAVYAEEIRALADPAARRERVQARLVELCSAVTRIDAAQLDLRLPLPSLGFDSILTAEIRGQIRTHFGVEVPLAGMLLGANLARVADLVLAALDAAPAGDGVAAADAPAAVVAASTPAAQQLVH